MRSTRRRIIQLPLLAVVAGCTPSPIISGTPGSAPEPVVPTRSAAAEAVAVWVGEFAELIDAMADSAVTWGADDQYVAWLTALQSQSSAHLARVVSVDPVIGGSTDFPVPSPTAAAPAPTTAAEALAALTATASEGMAVLESAVTSSEDGQERLFLASIATATSASLVPALPPADGGSEPAPFDVPDLGVAFTIALTHVWVLIQALEIGLGRLPRQHPLLEAGTQRLDSARVMRNRLLAALTGEPPQMQTWQLPNALSTPEEIRTAWGVLENNVLDALGTVVAADAQSPVEWLEQMLTQVDRVHQWGARLPHWPGWVPAP
ncbi:MAG: hypothetical protein Q4P15_02995 [Propionibacteriaceae bacterium]|nr:hypothetical protein [Propionibacteriaceae bacterium]